MNITLSNPQTKFFNSTAKHVGCIAGLGSGKTFCLVLKMLNDYFSHKGCHLLYMAPTYSLVADIAYPLFEEMLSEMKVPYSLNKTDGVLTVTGYGRIFFRTYTKPERIIGFSIFRAYLDEGDTIPEKQMDLIADKVIARIRQKIEGKLNQIFYISSPEGFGWFYNNFEKNPMDNSELIRMTTYDNAANLPPDYISTMREKYPQSLIDAYLMGMFVNINALGVWSDFDRKLNSSDQTVVGNEKLHVGMDFNVGRGCAVIHVRRDKDMNVDSFGMLHAVDEISGTIDTPATINELRERYPKNPVVVYPDASGKSRKSTNATNSDIALLSEAKFIVKANSKNPAVKDRVTATNAQFCNGDGERRYFVNTDSCPIYTEALEQQVYDDKGMPVKDGKIDDITDAGSYPVAFLFPVKSNKMHVTSTGGL